MFTLIETKTVPTVEARIHNRPITFHSKYDPLKEATTWANTAAEEVYDVGNIVVIGLAAGYHIIELAKRLPNRQIDVLEFNEAYAKWFKTTPLYENLQNLQNVKVYTIAKTTKLDELLNTHSSNIRIHRSGMDLMPEEFYGAKEVLKDIEMGQRSFRAQKENVFRNFELNQQFRDEGIAQLKNQYEGKKAILIAAGPSLDKQLPLLKQIAEEGEIVLGAVGTAMKPLKKAGITPDFFAIIDPNEGTLPQLTDVEFPNTPLYYMCTAYHETIKLHTGPKNIFYQAGLDISEKQAYIKNEPLLRSGGSVANALLELLVYFGCNPIALVGQDLAYTNDKSHAQNANATKTRTGTITVQAWNRKSTVTTDRNLNSYRKWFERYVLQNPQLNVYNCTEGGALISTINCMKLTKFQILK